MVTLSSISSSLWCTAVSIVSILSCRFWAHRARGCELREGGVIGRLLLLLLWLPLHLLRLLWELSILTWAVHKYCLVCDESSRMSSC